MSKKIDRVKLSQLLRQGKPGIEVAQYFGVTPGAISKAKKELNINVVKSVALENAHLVVGKNLDAVTQLQSINKKAHQIINDLSKKPDRADRQVILKACGEIRKQLVLQLEIFKALYDMEAVAEFQKEVLSIIGEVEPSVRDAIVKKLKEGRALRQSVSIN